MAAASPHSLKNRLKRFFRTRFLRVPKLKFGSGLGEGAWLLYGLVRSMHPKVCVEIGSARGLSACYVGLALQHSGGGRLYAIDPHTDTQWNDQDAEDSHETMKANLKAFRVEDSVEIIRDYSQEAAKSWQHRIDMIFIDGDHSYEGVKRDWELFLPHLKPFGVVIFHDTIWDVRPDPRYQREDMGVPAFVEELRRQGYPVITVDKHCGISMVQPRIGGMSLAAPQTERP